MERHLFVGSVQLARAVTDPELSERFLATAFSHAMALAGPTSTTEAGGSDV